MELSRTRMEAIVKHAETRAADPPVWPNLYAEAHAEGGQTLHSFERDPKHLAFVLARYLHVAKMLAGKGRVLEVGCGDGFASRIVRQHVADLTAIDTDEASIREAWARTIERWPINFQCADLLSGKPWLGFDAVYALDVFEHIADTRNLLMHLRAAAPVCIIGTPSLESQVHASELSRLGHVACKSGEDLRMACRSHWRHVFLFTMHDTTLSTSFLPMSQYLLALCVE